MLQWSIREQSLALKYQWKINQGQAQLKKIYFVQVKDQDRVGQGEAAGVTGLSNYDQKTLTEQFQDQMTALQKEGAQPHILKKLPAPLAFAVDAAWNSYLAQTQGVSLSEWLKLSSPKPCPTSYAIPILESHELTEFYNKHKLSRFSALKLKISSPSHWHNCQMLSKIYPGQIWIDANEAFQCFEDVVNFLKPLKDLNITFLEQPFARDNFKEQNRLKQSGLVKVFADESLQNQDLPENWRHLFDGVNVKLMKAGSYQQAIRQMQQARDLGLEILLGCMVETTLGISSALQVSPLADYYDLDGFLYLKDDPHNLVYEKNGLLHLA